MTRTMLGQYIVADPAICHGKPTFVGTRIMVFQVLQMVADGLEWETISKKWSGKVSKEAIAEAVALASRVMASSTVVDQISNDAQAPASP